MGSSFLSQNRAHVRLRHYMQKATADNHWYAFSRNRVQNLRAKFGKDFCLIIDGSAVQNDAYIIPYEQFATFYTDDYVDSRGRWVGTIRNNQIKLTAPGFRGLVWSSACRLVASEWMLPTVSRISCCPLNPVEKYPLASRRFCSAAINASRSNRVSPRDALTAC
jgi:hypothetical protein